MSKQAAEERFDRDEDDYAALVVGFTEGWEAALPENPDPAVIEAMARAIAPHRWREVHREPPGDLPQARWDALLDQAIAEGREPSLEAARAAYAAMRGAMQ
jgi:hypothetical protein